LNLATSVQRSVSNLASTGRLERHVVDVRAEPVWASADPTRLNQIVANLLTNAIKYTSPGGTIRIRVGGEEDQAIVGVADTGIGIPPSLLPYMFDLPVQGDKRLDRAQGGLGVGLTLVRRLVELHGGRVQVFSEGPGRGSPRSPSTRSCFSGWSARSHRLGETRASWRPDPRLTGLFTSVDNQVDNTRVLDHK
jgi:signal transduction histidine kinase